MCSCTTSPRAPSSAQQFIDDDHVPNGSFKGLFGLFVLSSLPCFFLVGKMDNPSVYDLSRFATVSRALVDPQAARCEAIDVEEVIRGIRRAVFALQMLSGDQADHDDELWDDPDRAN